MSIIALLVDGIVYFLLALYIEQVNPSKYEMSKPFYFFLMPKFWKGIWQSLCSCRICPYRLYGGRYSWSSSQDLLNSSSDSDYRDKDPSISMEVKTSKRQTVPPDSTYQRSMLDRPQGTAFVPSMSTTALQVSHVQPSSSGKSPQIDGGVEKRESDSRKTNTTEARDIPVSSPALLPKVIYSVARLPNGEIAYELEDLDHQKKEIIIETQDLWKRFIKRDLWCCGYNSSANVAVKGSSFQVKQLCLVLPTRL